MLFTRIEKDEDLAKLARRVYPKASGEALRAAERALREANPHLADPRQVPAGAIVVVPDVDAEGVRIRAEASGESSIIQGLLAEARRQLGNIGNALNRRLDRQTEEAKSNIALTKSPDLRKHIAKFPELRTQLDQITAQEEGRLKTVETLRRLHSDGLTQLNRDLDDFLGAPPQPDQPPPRPPRPPRPEPAPSGQAEGEQKPRREKPPRRKG